MVFIELTRVGAHGAVLIWAHCWAAMRTAWQCAMARGDVERHPQHARAGGEGGHGSAGAGGAGRAFGHRRLRSTGWRR